MNKMISEIKVIVIGLPVVLAFFLVVYAFVWLLENFGDYIIFVLMTAAVLSTAGFWGHVVLDYFTPSKDRRHDSE